MLLEASYWMETMNKYSGGREGVYQAALVEGSRDSTPWCW